MHQGQLVFAQLMRHLPLSTFRRCVAHDATTIDLCLSVFPWAPFRSTKAAIKLHTMFDLRGNIPSFIHISDGKLHDVNVLDQLIPEASESECPRAPHRPPLVSFVLVVVPHIYLYLTAGPVTCNTDVVSSQCRDSQGFRLVAWAQEHSDLSARRSVATDADQ